jgi:hypothetical protein
MATNFAPQHKSKIKAILDLVTWDGETFGLRESAGNQHIFDTSISEILRYPTITISQINYRSDVEDTMYNKVSCTYRIRVFFGYQDNSKLAEDVIDELISLIQTTLTDYFVGSNATSWESARLGASDETQDNGGGLLYRHLTFETVNRDIRTQNQIPN